MTDTAATAVGAKRGGGAAAQDAEDAGATVKRARGFELDDVGRAIRQDLALCYRLCERFGLHEGVCNHLSVQLPGKDEFMLVEYGVHWSQVCASNILVLSRAGDVLLGAGKPERTAFSVHRAIHLALGERAAAVLHTHMPFATALMALQPACGGRILPVHQNVLRFNGWVAYDDDYGGFFDDQESSRAAAVAVRFRDDTGRSPRAMMSANHGVFTFGASVAEAWDDLYYLERLCEVQVRALSAAGGDLSKLRLVSDETLSSGAALAESDRPIGIAAHWRGMQGMMRNTAPDYRK